MFYWVALIFVMYIVLIIRFATRMASYSELMFEEEVLREDRNLQKSVERKKVLYEEKMNLESEALEIFTLYEITKEITKSLNEEDAFKIFKQKLRKHVVFKECQFYDPLSEEIKYFKKSNDYFVFTLQGRRRRIGYLVLQGINKEDEEKIMILGHQFALALRRVHLYEEIEKIAITDSLTELYTRHYTLERFEEEIERSKIRKIHMSFLMIDVDFFKKYNDKYGHLTGDQILREIGHIIHASIREIDIAGRFGGEEFCVVLPDTDSEGAEYAAERIRSATEGASIKAYDTTVNVTVSVGIATFPKDGKKGSELMDKADWALYRAKKQGRNRICSFGVYKD